MNSLPRIALVAAATLFSNLGARAETARFLMSGPAFAAGSAATESYVVAVSDPTVIQQARAYLASHTGGPYLVPHVKIAAGADAINRNLAEPGHPAWAWHATELVEWTSYDPLGIYPAVYLPNLHTWPSRVVSEVLNGRPPSVIGEPPAPPYDAMTLVGFPLVMELGATDAGAVVNVSTRGWVGTGERVLITGFVVQGSAPRNVLVRALGPSLAPLGVTEVLADPSVSVYRGAERIAVNDNWGSGNLPAVVPGVPEIPQPWYAWLRPANAKESAMRLSLPPGAYSVQVSGVGGAGVALAEVFDLDALAPR
jgi:hypothetical protein